MAGKKPASRPLPPVAAAFAIALVLLTSASAQPPGTRRMSLSSSAAQANGHSFAAALSGDGRWVSFYSDATNLVAGDTNGARDVFVHDVQTGATTRASVGPGGAQANGPSFAPAVSGNGRLVAFYSFASNVVPGDTNGVDDVFVRDLVGGTTTRVSLDSGGAQANGGSYSPTLSADGRFVAFTSDATNLVPGDSNNQRDVFVHDLQTGATERVSVDSAGVQGNLDSSSPSLSADGRFVAFSSFATNLVADDTNDGSDVFVRDRQTGTTTRVSVYNGGIEGDGDAFRPSISGDGRFVAFDSDMWDIVWGDTNDAFDVFVHDVQGNTTARASVDDTGAQAGGGSMRPSLSPDGRFVSFESEASNLVAGDTNGASDVFVHDNQSGATTRVSVDSAGAEGNNDSLRSSISADGRFVAFESQAANLVARDSNRFTDVFVRDTTAAPAPPPPAPPAQCRVPRVIGIRLVTARSRIRKANCRVGRVRRARARRHVGRVVAQSPAAGARLAKGAKVNLVVGRR